MKRSTFTSTGSLPWQSVQESTVLDGQRVAPSGDCSSFTAQVAIPLFQALLTGVFVGGGSWLLWYAFVAPETAKLAGLAMALLGAGAAWLVLMADSRGLLRLYETFGSGARQEELEPQQPQPPAERVVFVHSGDQPKIDTPQPDPERPQPSDFERLLAIALAEGTASLEDHFRRSYVQEVRDKLISGGFASWRSAKGSKGKTAGWQLTERGKKLAERAKEQVGSR